MKVKVEPFEEIQFLIGPARVPGHFLCATHIRTSSCPPNMTPTEAQAHVARAHSTLFSPDIKCKKCHWSFIGSGNLARYLAHQIMHVSVKTCTVCNKSFRDAEERLSHFCTAHGYSATTTNPPT